MFYARARVIRAQSDDKDTAKTVNFNVLIFFFLSKKVIFSCIFVFVAACELKS